MDDERLLSMSEGDFLQFLSVDDLKKEYNSKVKSKIGEIKAEFESRRDFLEKSKRDGIETDRRHRDLINSCVYPFTKKGPLAQTGYRFVRAAPLAELNIPNLDFLLFKHVDRFNIAVFGECKGSISSYSAIIKELKSRKDEVQRNTDYIKGNYLGLSGSDKLYVEYVIAVPTNDAVEMLNQIIESGGEQIVWQIAITSNPEISIAFPPKNISGIRRESMMHRDHQLNRALDPTRHTQSNRNVINIFPQCHPFIKLCSLLRAARSGDTGLIVDREDLRDTIVQDLFYMRDDIIDLETNSLLSKGVDIEFLEWADLDYAYKIKARGTKRSGLEKQMEEKWIKYQIKCDLDKCIDASIQTIRREFAAKREKVKTLLDYT